MARVVKTKKIRKKRIKETEKNLRKQLRDSGLSRKEARKQAGETAEDVYETGRQKTLAENAAKRAENQAKREATQKSQEETQAKLKQSKAESAQKLKDQELANRVTVGGKTYRDQASADAAIAREESKKSDERTARGQANIQARTQAKPGESYQRIDATGQVTTKRKTEKPSDSNKKNQGKTTVKTVKTSNQGKVTKEPVAKTVKTSNQGKPSKTSTSSKPSSYSTSGAVKSDATMKNVVSKKTDPVKSGSAGSGSVKKTPSYDTEVGFLDRLKMAAEKGDQAVRNLPGTIGKGVDRARKYFGFEHGGRINKLKKKAKHGGALAIMIAPVKTKKMKAVKKAPGGASMKKMSVYKDGGSLKPSMKKGGSFPDLTGDNKVTQADILKGRGVFEYGGKVKYQEGGKVTGPDKKKKSVVTVDQDLKDLGNALKEGVKMITIPGYGAMKLSQYISKRKKGMSKTEIAKAMSSAGRQGAAEAAQEMARKSGSKKLGMKKSMVNKKLGMKKSMVKKPTMKRTMTKLVKTKDTRPYSKRPRPDYIPQTVRDKKKMEDGGKITKKQKAKMDAKAKKLQKDNKPKINKLSGGVNKRQVSRLKKATQKDKYQDPAMMVEKEGTKLKPRAFREMMYGGSMKKAMYDAKIKKMENGGKVKKRTTTVTENTPSRFSKFTDAQKTQIKDRAKKLTGEDKKDFDYALDRTKDTKSKTTTTTKRRSGKVKSQSVTEKTKSSIPGRSTDVTTTSKKRRKGSTRVKITSYGAGDDRDAGRVVKQRYNRKGKLKKTKIISKGQSKVKPLKGTSVFKGQPDEYEYKK